MGGEVRVGRSDGGQQEEGEERLGWEVSFGGCFFSSGSGLESGTGREEGEGVGNHEVVGSELEVEA